MQATKQDYVWALILVIVVLGAFFYTKNVRQENAAYILELEQAITDRDSTIALLNRTVNQQGDEIFGKERILRDMLETGTGTSYGNKLDITVKQLPAQIEAPTDPIRIQVDVSQPSRQEVVVPVSRPKRVEEPPVKYEPSPNFDDEFNLDDLGLDDPDDNMMTTLPPTYYEPGKKEVLYCLRFGGNNNRHFPALGIENGETFDNAGDNGVDGYNWTVEPSRSLSGDYGVLENGTFFVSVDMIDRYLIPEDNGVVEIKTTATGWRPAPMTKNGRYYTFRK